MGSLSMEGSTHMLVSDSMLFQSPDNFAGRLDDFVSGMVTVVLLHQGALRSAKLNAVFGVSSYAIGCVAWNMSQLGLYANGMLHGAVNVLLWVGNCLLLASLARTQLDRSRALGSTSLCPFEWLLRRPLLRHVGSMQYAIYFAHQATYHDYYYAMGSSM